MIDSQFRFASALEIGRAIQSKTISSVGVTTSCLAVLDTHGRALNAVAELLPEFSIAQAKQADAEIAAGLIRSPLHGVPWGAKDLLATKGIPTRWGSPAHADQVFDFDATVVERLHAAGCVMVAKLSMVELAGGGGYEFANASIDGPCKCPFAESRWAGGSSSGSGAAVGAGCLPFAIGTETWGSITIPSAFCNVTGLRPTYGRVPRFGAMELCFSLDKIGPMARTADDCAAILSIIAGHDPRDPISSKLVYDGSLPPDRTLKLGILKHDYSHVPQAKQRFDMACNMLRSLGHSVEMAKLADFPFDEAATAIVQVEGSAAFEKFIRSERLELLVDSAQKKSLLAGLDIPVATYFHAMRTRAIAMVEAAKIFTRFDALIAPTLLHVAPPITQSLEESFPHMGGNGAAGNLLGWPSISVPMGMGEDGLPLGLEIIGASFNEATILAIASAFQMATSHHRSRPGVL